MLSKRQFLAIHEQAVISIRTLKYYNDSLNKRIGINNDISLFYETQSQSQSIQESSDHIAKLISKMEENYLDPDTSRKIGSLKQQFRMQENRRAQLLVSLSQITQTIAFQKQKKKTKLRNTFQPLQIQSQRHIYSSAQEKRSSNKTLLTDTTSKSELQQTEVLMDCDFDYDIERKLIQQKKEILGNTHQQINNIRQVAIDTSRMVYEQGDRLDIIGDDLFKGYKNLEMANEELSQASLQQKKGRNKRICCIFVFFVLLVCSVAGWYFFMI